MDAKDSRAISQVQKQKGTQKQAVQTMRARFVKALERPPQVSAQQKLMRSDRPVKGPIWVSKTTVPAPPELDLLDSLWRAVQDLADGDEVLTKPGYARDGLWAEWTGPRPGVSEHEALPSVSEGERYHRLVKDAKSDHVIFFLHGGAYSYGSPVIARPIASQLTHLTHYPVLTLNYRLSPQVTFPTHLLDVLTAYFTLLSPPPTSLHPPTPAPHIVLAGESAGAALHLALVQTLLHWRRQGLTCIRFNGRDIPLADAMPAGVAGMSPPAETLSCAGLPSSKANHHIDWTGFKPPWLQDHAPRDAVWPSDPPRAQIFADATALAHPLLSVALARDWRGAPPVWLSTGQEVVSDGVKAHAQLMARQGVPVRFHEYEGMPHLFYAFLTGSPQARHCVRSCADACGRFVEGRSEKSGALSFRMGDLQSTRLDVEDLMGMTHDEFAETLRRECKRLVATGWVWDGPTWKGYDRRETKAAL